MGLHYTARGAGTDAERKPPERPVDAEAAGAGVGPHYAALGVGPNASPEQLRAAYRAAVLRLHPDKAAAGSGGAAARFQDVQLAWEVRVQQRAPRCKGLAKGLWGCSCTPTRSSPCTRWFLCGRQTRGVCKLWQNWSASSACILRPHAPHPLHQSHAVPDLWEKR